MRDKSFDVVAEISDLSKVIKLKSKTKFRQDALGELLKLCGNDDFSSAVGIKREAGQIIYIVRQTIPFLQSSPQFIAEVIFQYISDARKVYHLLGTG